MLFTSYNLRKAFLILGDSLVLIGSIFAAILIKNGLASPGYDLRISITMVLFAVGFFQTSLYFHDLYDLNSFGIRIALARRLASSLVVTSSLLASIHWFYPTLTLMPGFWLDSVLISVVLLYVWRIWIEKIGSFYRSSVMIVGTGEMAISIAREILSRPKLGIKVCGFLGEDSSMIGKSLINPCVIGTFDHLESLAAQHKVDRVLVALHDRRGRLPVAALLKLKLAGVAVEEGASFFEWAFGKLPVEELNPSYLFFSSGFGVSRLTLNYKRAFSIILSLIGLIVSAPLMLLTAIAIKLDSPGPVFFRQERVGKGGRLFNLIKFRSMNIDAEASTGPVWAQTDDPRVTKVGRFIRRLRIDEMPQFINVLKGDMHFVGPRPERPYFVEQLEEVVHYYMQRHTVKPGITGWAQVKYPYGATVEEAREKLNYDLYYIKNVSILLDLWIVFQTVKIVLLGRGAR